MPRLAKSGHRVYMHDFPLAPDVPISHLRLTALAAVGEALDRANVWATGNPTFEVRHAQRILRVTMEVTAAAAPQDAGTNASLLEPKCPACGAFIIALMGDAA